MIRIDNVTMRFGRATAVDAVSLDIPAGDSVALWGVNGAGKTTLIRCVLGLLRHAGRITVAGRDARCDGKAARANIGYVPQELGFYDELRVGEAIGFFARLKGVAVPSTEAELERVGLPGQSRKRIRELSGGMKQRLALAIALLGDPPVLILDEVTASLDACGRAEFVALLARLSGAGRTMLFASHRIEEVTTLAKRVVLLERGRVTGDLPAARFAESLGHGAVLHLSIPVHSREPAMRRLREAGFSPRLNGVGLVVPVPADQKAAPFRLLSEARISVEDFELVTAAPSRDESRKEATS